MNPLDPAYMKGFNDGMTTGKKESAELFSDFLTERMEALVTIPGIGEKTAFKIHEHFMERVDGK